MKKLQSITLSGIDPSKGLFVAIKVNETGAKKLREKATDKEQFDLDVIRLTTNEHKPLKMLAGCNDVNICIYKIFNNMFSGGHRAQAWSQGQWRAIFRNCGGYPMTVLPSTIWDWEDCDVNKRLVFYNEITQEFRIF